MRVAGEMAFPILWLASDEASYVTGTAVMADGGGLMMQPETA